MATPPTAATIQGSVAFGVWLRELASLAEAPHCPQKRAPAATIAPQARQGRAPSGEPQVVQ
jgi:hypothetical protein